MMDQKQLHKRKKLQTDFDYYSRNCLLIRTKDGTVDPFTLNDAQLYIHKRIEEQRDKTGKVRAIILKGRQQGCSTYVEGRYYWRTTHRKGVRAFILAHESESTGALFEMAKRYHDNCPKFVKPVIRSSNAKELSFAELDSGYKIGTAGNDSVGRGTTIQYFHGSEVAFWKNTGELTKGILQAVPDAPETEVIYESTANGVGNFFHQQCVKAMKGDTEFQFIFVPWFWQKEYTKPVPGDFKPTDEELTLVDLYGLDKGQLVWRRNKIQELSTDGMDGGKAFKQEYPNNPNEAFQVSGDNGLISPASVMKARKSECSANGPIVIGVDPSRGGDRFGVAIRQGRKIYGLEGHTGDINLGKAVQICKRLLDKHKPVKMFVDAGGGADLVDRLHELGYERVVKAIPFGGSPLDPEKYKNKRAEMWGLLNTWLCDESLDVQLPDDDGLQADLCMPQYERDSMDRIVLESKDKMRKRGLPSPDLADACVLTFAEPVRENSFLSNAVMAKSDFEVF
jgi:hypothetical protein